MNVFKTLSVLFIVTMSLFTACDNYAKVVEEHIYIVPVGAVDKKILQAIKRRLPEILPEVTRVEINTAEKIPENAFDPSRNQYDAAKMLDYLSGRVTIAVTNETVLAITDADLYVPGTEYVLGYADPKKVMCIISTARLNGEQERVLIERLKKEAMHQLGSSWGLTRCSNPKCVMYFSDTTSGADKKKDVFCHDCRKRLHRRYLNPMITLPQF